MSAPRARWWRSRTCSPAWARRSRATRRAGRSPCSGAATSWCCTTRRASPRWTATSSCSRPRRALEGGRWLVPVDALPRLLGPLLERPVEWRAAPRVLVVGKVSIPKVTVSTFVSGELARVVFEASEKVPFRVQQEPGRVTVADRRATSWTSRFSQQRLDRRDRGVGAVPRRARRTSSRSRSGRRFQELKATEQESPAAAGARASRPPLAAGERGRRRGAAPRPAPRARRRSPRVRTVVIDPGHGGEDVGAQGAGGHAREGRDARRSRASCGRELVERAAASRCS